MGAVARAARDGAKEMAGGEAGHFSSEAKLAQLNFSPASLAILRLISISRAFIASACHLLVAEWARFRTWSRKRHEFYVRAAATHAIER